MCCNIGALDSEKGSRGAGAWKGLEEVMAEQIFKFEENDKATGLRSWTPALFQHHPHPWAAK